MKIERDGSIYEVIDENDFEYQVKFSFTAACNDGKREFRTMKLWWYKKYCKLVKGE